MLEIGRIVRTKGGPSKERLQQGYKKLLSIVGRVVWQAKRFSREVAAGTKRADEAKQQTALEALQKQPDTFVPRVQQVMRQANSGCLEATLMYLRTRQHLRTRKRNHS